MGRKAKLTMKNFLLLGDHIDPEPFLAEITDASFAWRRSIGRQHNIKVPRVTVSIPLRGIQKSMIMGRKRRDVHETRDTTVSRNFPHTMEFMRSFAAKMNGRLGRARMTKLPPGEKLESHVEEGAYYQARDRFHLVLQTMDGNYHMVGDEQIYMQRGELWWLDNNLPQEARNRSTEERIHLVFDVEPLSAGYSIRNLYREMLVGEQMERAAGAS